MCAGTGFVHIARADSSATGEGLFCDAWIDGFCALNTDILTQD